FRSPWIYPVTSACHHPSFFLFFFTAPATTEIYTLSLHDALPIFAIIATTRWQSRGSGLGDAQGLADHQRARQRIGQHQRMQLPGDRKSTRLNSSHVKISYAVFCLKKKKKTSKKHHHTHTEQEREV